jgi:hypothetical protein
MGALTLKVFSDELVEWNLLKEGIDPTDSFGVSLRLSVRENQYFWQNLASHLPLG